jgi:hypothetical protein
MLDDNRGWVGRDTCSILNELNRLQQDIDEIEFTVDLIASTVGKTEAAHIQLLNLIKEVIVVQSAMSTKVDTILSYLEPSQIPVGFTVTETVLSKEKLMAKAKATVDLQILDDGKGVLFTLTPVNAAGGSVPLPTGTVVVATSSAPATLTVAADPGDPTATPPRAADTTGLVFLGSVVKPVVDATGVTVGFSDTLATGTITATSAPVDIVADNSAVGFTVTEAAL